MACLSIQNTRPWNRAAILTQLDRKLPRASVDRRWAGLVIWRHALKSGSSLFPPTCEASMFLGSTFPTFSICSKFNGKDQSAARWLNSFNHELRSAGNLPPQTYLEYLDHFAARGCRQVGWIQPWSSPSFEHWATYRSDRQSVHFVIQATCPCRGRWKDTSHFRCRTCRSSPAAFWNHHGILHEDFESDL